MSESLPKALSGEWSLVSGERLGVEVEAAPDEPFLSYSVSSGGHSVIEKRFVGKPNEMTSIYYLDSGMLYMATTAASETSPE